MTSLSTSTNEMETLTFVADIPQRTNVETCQVVPTTSPIAVTPARNEGSLRFVGTFSHTPDVTQNDIIAMLKSAKASSQETLLNPSLPSSSNSGVTREHTHPSASKTILSELC